MIITIDSCCKATAALLCAVTEIAVDFNLKRHSLFYRSALQYKILSRVILFKKFISTTIASLNKQPC